MKKIAAERINSLLYRLERDSAMSCAVGARDTSGGCVEIIRYLQSHLEELNQKVDELEMDAQLTRARAISDCAELLSKQHTLITNIAAATLVMNIDTSMQANKQ